MQPTAFTDVKIPAEHSCYVIIESSAEGYFAYFRDKNERFKGDRLIPPMQFSNLPELIEVLKSYQDIIQSRYNI